MRLLLAIVAGIASQLLLFVVFTLLAVTTEDPTNGEFSEAEASDTEGAIAMWAGYIGVYVLTALFGGFVAGAIAQASWRVASMIVGIWAALQLILQPMAREGSALSAPVIAMIAAGAVVSALVAFAGGAVLGKRAANDAS